MIGRGVEPRVELALRRTLFFALFLSLYLLFGACIFTVLPRRHQTIKCEKSVTKLDAQRGEMLNVLWAETMAQSEHEWFLMANQKLDIYERLVLKACKQPNAASPKSFSNAFVDAFSLVTTTGFVNEENLTAVGKLVAIAYASIGIPLALLFLGQCSKMLSGIFPGSSILIAAPFTVFIGAIIYDIIEDSDEDTPFIDALFNVFVMMSTVGSCSQQPMLTMAIFSFFAISLISVSHITIQRYIEHSLQGFELTFSSYFGIGRRWVCSKRDDESDEHRIIEEDEEEETVESDS